MLKKISNIVAVIGGILLLWISVSCIDYAEHNNPFDSDYQNYWKYNFFDIVYGW